MTEKTLYERLGGADGIRSIVNDTVDNHLKNPAISARFKDSDPAKLKEVVFGFFAAGSGGPESYTGKDMVSAHAGMNINAAEMMAVFDDAMGALDKNGVGQREKDEVLGILYSLRGEVIGQ